MRGWMRRQSVVFGAAGLFVLATATPALADVRAHWAMNDLSAPMTDSSPYQNHSSEVVDVAFGRPGVAPDGGTAFGFNGTTSYVFVPDKDNSLDPYDADITVTAWVRLVGPLLDDSYDLVRKGLGNTPGGDWKMEVKNIRRLGAVGKLKCTFRGDPGVEVVKTARPDIIDGQPHELKCIKTAVSVSAVVDGRAYTKLASAGTIANDREVMVGSKIPGDDVYSGDLDEVTVEIGTP